MAAEQLIGMLRSAASKISPQSAKALSDPKLVGQVKQAYNSLSHDKAGAIKAVQQFGGMDRHRA